jgi:hypothetical protein
MMTTIMALLGQFCNALHHIIWHGLHSRLFPPLLKTAIGFKLRSIPTEIEIHHYCGHTTAKQRCDNDANQDDSDG